MSIRRNPQRGRWTVIGNDALEDRRLSFGAVGLLSYILSKPDSWTIRTSEVMSRGNIGRVAYSRMMGELRDAGYAVLVQTQGAGGKATGSFWDVSECPPDRVSENPTSGKPDSIVKTDLVVMTETAVKTETPPTPTDAPPTSTALTTARPTSPAGNPADQVAERTVPTREQQSATPSRAPRSTKTTGSSAPAGESEARGGRWAPVAAAIMAAIGRPAPRGKLPSWLGNAVATFGAAAGDDPGAAMGLVAGWTKSRPLREALERGIVRDHTVPAMVGSWIAAGNGGQPPAGVAQKADPQALRMQRLGAPDNWRELVYTHDGTKRSPVLALPRIGLEPYASPTDWPAWYRAFEGVGS